MEYILLFIDFLRTREKRIFLVNVIIPLIVSIIVFLYSDSCRFYSVVDAIQSDILSVIGILLGFTISVFAIFLTSEGANIEKARNSYIEKVKLGSEPVSLYRAITINFTYIVRQFGIKKCPKKLVISLLFCNFIVDNQLITNIYSDDYH